MTMRDIRRLVALGVLLLALAAGWPSAQAQTAERCFSLTNQCIAGNIRVFWEQNGTERIFGLPISFRPDEGSEPTVQWFQRARLEWHPEEPDDSPYRVQLGRIGLERLQQLGRDPASEERENGPRPGCLWFEETGHNVCDQVFGVGFRSFWLANGLTDPRLDMDAYQRSLALFGLPLTSEQLEVNPADGQPYLTQWFERARFEWHPENPDEFKVLLGLVGQEVQEAATPTPAPPAVDLTELAAFVLTADDLPDDFGWISEGVVTNEEAVETDPHPATTLEAFEQQGRLGAYEVRYERSRAEATANAGPLAISSDVIAYADGDGAAFGFAHFLFRYEQRGFQSISVEPLGAQAIGQRLLLREGDHAFEAFSVLVQQGASITRVRILGLQGSTTIDDAYELAVVAAQRLP